MRTIALISTAGGAGRTTVCAGLASLLTARRLPVLALDLDPRNSLGLQLGLPVTETDGIAVRDSALWHAAAFENSDGVRLLPYGAASPAQSGAFGARLQDQPHWLSENLSRLLLPPETLVLVDTPRLPDAVAEHAIAQADYLLNIVTADAAAYGEVRLVEQEFGRSGRLYHALNQLDSSRPLQRDIVRLLRDELGERLSPYPLHRDASVPEAVANNLSLFSYAPSSQAAHDFQGLASWLVGLLNTRAVAA